MDLNGCEEAAGVRVDEVPVEVAHGWPNLNDRLNGDDEKRHLTCGNAVPDRSDRANPERV